MNSEMMEALENIEREKGISDRDHVEALANALLTAYKRMPDAARKRWSRSTWRPVRSR